METRKQAIFLTPLKGMDEVLEQEYKKGEIAGLELARKFAEIRIEAIREQIQELTQQVERDNVTENHDEADGN